jgi:hypothetical protein
MLIFLPHNLPRLPVWDFITSDLDIFLFAILLEYLLIIV